MDSNECPNCRRLAEENVCLEAELELVRAEYRMAIERRLGEGIDVTHLLDAIAEAGFDVAEFLTP